jgi:hypothetical protein
MEQCNEAGAIALKPDGRFYPNGNQEGSEEDFGKEVGFQEDVHQEIGQQENSE